MSVVAQGVLPAQTRETVKVRVCGYEGAPVLDCHGGVLSIGNKLSGCAGATAQILEDLDVARAGVDEPRVGPGGEFTDECEDFVQS